MIPADMLEELVLDLTHKELLYRKKQEASGNKNREDDETVLFNFSNNKALNVLSSVKYELELANDLKKYEN